MTGWGAWAVVPAFMVHALWGAPGPGPARYPWAGAACEYGAAGGPACARPGSPGDLYNWGYAGPGSFRPGDPWGYEYRNCTSYVAWRLSRAGVAAALFTGLGDAGQWMAGAAGEPGVTVDHVPARGAVAVWAAGRGVGHVAWVESVRGGAVSVSDFNNAGTGAYARHLLTGPPTGYLHFPSRRRSGGSP